MSFVVGKGAKHMSETKGGNKTFEQVVDTAIQQAWAMFNLAANNHWETSKVEGWRKLYGDLKAYRTRRQARKHGSPKFLIILCPRMDKKD